MHELYYKIDVFESFLNTSNIKYTFIEEIGHFKRYYLNNKLQFTITKEDQYLRKSSNVEYTDSELGNIINFLMMIFDSIEIKNY